MFSYDSYRKIIELIQKSGRQATYQEACERDDFILMRHDVEFSVERAYDLARLEQSMGFTSAYFFQWTNNSYNLLSKPNIEMIHKMNDKGHTIGLHYALNGLENMNEVRERIKLEVAALSSLLEFDIDAFSIHRPSKEVLAENLTIPGVINAYDKKFFTFADAVDENTKLEIKYLSDAQHKWNYGYPDEETIASNRKIQILTHPYSWTEEGYENAANFQTLLEEKHQELIDTINNECKHFAGVMGEMRLYK